MNTLQMSLKLKQKSGKFTVFDETREESNSMETSINEESDEGSSNARSARNISTKKNS